MFGRARHAIAFVICGGGAACIGVPDLGSPKPSMPPPTSSDTPDSGIMIATDAATPDGGRAPIDPIAEFREHVAPILGGQDGHSGSCGPCHALAGGLGPAFLLPNPDMLTTILHYPGLIGDAPETSRLYTRGRHEGPPLMPGEAAIVAQWIVDWNANKPSTGSGGSVNPTIDPFVPNMGPNQVDLSLIDPKLKRQTITFTATTVGTRDPSIMLTNLVLHTSTITGLHVVHPLFAIWDSNNVATPDAVDSFSGLDMVVGPNQTTAIGPGILILPHYGSGERINVAFELVEQKLPAPPQPPKGPTGCKSLALFTQNVQPVFVAACVTCHAGANPNATAAFNMSGVQDTSMANQAKACSSTLGEVDVNHPDLSRIYTYASEGSGIVHPFKLRNDDLETFRRSADNWISQEK